MVENKNSDVGCYINQFLRQTVPSAVPVLLISQDQAIRNA